MVATRRHGSELNDCALIPLDGTRNAEEALAMLPFLQTIGIRRVRLVGVWQPIENLRGRGATALVEASERGRALVGAYLQQQAGRLEALGLRIESTNREGDPAEEIVAEAGDCAADLIVMATHGRTGTQRWRLGSVADKVLRLAPCPSLVIGPNVHVRLSGYSVRRLLLPLDGSAAAEAAIPLAALIAERAGAELEMVRVPSLPSMWRPESTSSINLGEVEKWLTGGVSSYLQDVAPDLPAKRTTLPLTLSSAVESTLLDYLGTQPCDLVVLTSHGRHGLPRFLLGSIAESLLRGPVPVLIVHAGQYEAA